MLGLRPNSALLLLAGAAAASTAGAQGLTIDQALAMAKANNGTVRAALLQYQASRADARSAFAAYFPSVTPSFEYDVDRTETFTGFSKGLFDSTTGTSAVRASWLLLDSGTRDASYKRSAYFRDVSEQNSLQSLRNVLFSVHQNFYDALRAEEILKVRQKQLDRAVEIENQTKEFADTGAGPKKDVLQATADKLNAKAAELTARNDVSTARADLKAVLGVQEGQTLGDLQSPEETEIPATDYTLEQAIQDGLDHRPDLLAQKLRVKAQGQSVRLAKIDQGFTWTLDARHTRGFGPDPFDQSALVFQVSIPLYDGFRTREIVRSNQLSLDAEKATLTQSERDAMAEIESAYKEFSQNRERLDASKAALDAAQINYAAASDSRKEGASDLIEVLTAAVSLATAESNYIQAYYDTLISRVRLRLVTGQSLPGEDD